MNDFMDPAFRLRSILERAATLPHTMMAHEVWRAMFNAPDEKSVLFALFTNDKTIDQLEELGSASMSERERSIIQRSAVAVRNIFRVEYLNTAWQQVKAHITAELLANLENISIRHEYLGKEQALEESKISEWIQTTNTLLSDVLGSTESDLKRFVAPVLNRLLYILNNYRVFGNVALSESSHQALGLALVNSHKPETPMASRFKKLAINITFGLSILANVSQITGFTAQTLLQFTTPSHEDIQEPQPSLPGELGATVVGGVPSIDDISKS